MAKNFVDDRHALFTGAVLGLAWKNGLSMEPGVDDDGDYTPLLTLRIPGVPREVELQVMVPPPPEGWTLR